MNKLASSGARVGRTATDARSRPSNSLTDSMREQAMGNNLNATAPREGEINSSLRRLNLNVATLGNVVSSLAERLEPAMRPAHPDSGSNTSAPISVCNLSGIVDGESELVSIAVETITDLLNRLEL